MAEENIINEQTFKIGIIIGKTGIIDNDIKHQLRESIAFYDLSFHRVNLSSEEEIMVALDRLSTEHYGLIAISRGGGENLDIFNRFSLAEKVIGIGPLFITAIGHKDDITLLQKVADKSFITPSELGQFLNDTYNHTIEELQSSKAKLIDSVKAQLSANYQKEIANLNEKLKANDELRIQTTKDLEQIYNEKLGVLNSRVSGEQQLHGEKVTLLNEQINAYRSQVSALENRAKTPWAMLIIAIIVGVIIGFLLNRH